jgi:hypothetical protein
MCLYHVVLALDINWENKDRFLRLKKKPKHKLDPGWAATKVL